MTKLVLDGLPWKFRGLFLHSEFMMSQEQGLYLAWDNRPPALITQVWLKNRQEVDGELHPAQEPAHLNVLLHEKIGYQELWNDGTLNWMLEQMAKLMDSDFSPAKFHELSIAGNDSRPCGISVGVETVREEQAAGPVVDS